MTAVLAAQNATCTCTHKRWQHAHGDHGETRCRVNAGLPAACRCEGFRRPVPLPVSRRFSDDDLLIDRTERFADTQEEAE